MTTLSQETLSSIRKRICEIYSGTPNRHVTSGIQWYKAGDDGLGIFVARCRSPLDVMRALDFARRMGLPISIRYDALDINGEAVGDVERGGAEYRRIFSPIETRLAKELMIDLSRMKGVHIDGQTVTVGAGTAARDVATASSRRGLTIADRSLGSASIAHLFASGGFAPFIPDCHMVGNSLLNAQLVCRDHRILNASALENIDVFQAIRGGRATPGIVTTAQFKLEPMAERFAGLLVFPWCQVERIFDGFLKLAASGSPDLSLTFGVLAGSRGERFVMLSPVWNAGSEGVESAFAACQALGVPIIGLGGSTSPSGALALRDIYFPEQHPPETRVLRLARLSEEVFSRILESCANPPPLSALLFHCDLAGSDITGKRNFSAHIISAASVEGQSAGTAWTASLLRSLSPFITTGNGNG